MNTNNISAAELQAYVNSLQDSTQWYDLPGMLGVSALGSLMGTLLLSVLIRYAIGVYHNKKHNGFWLLPDKRFWFEVFRGLSIFWKTFAGIPTPKAFMDRSDGEYEGVPPLKIVEGVNFVHNKMEREGWTLQAYESRVLDCEDFAMKMKVELTKYYSTVYDVVDAGVPVSLFGYKRDKDNRFHVVVRVLDWTGKSHYYEAFPGYPDALTLTPRELLSCNLDFM